MSIYIEFLRLSTKSWDRRATSMYDYGHRVGVFKTRLTRTYSDPVTLQILKKSTKITRERQFLKTRTETRRRVERTTNF